MPSFPDFPAGVQSGGYRQTFDMNLPSSYNPAFIIANGGNPAAAWMALYASQDCIGKASQHCAFHGNVHFLF